MARAPFVYDNGDWVRQDDSGFVSYRDLSDNWNPLGRGEHAESQGYTGIAVGDPQIDKLFALNAYDPSLLSREQKHFFSNPMTGLDSFGQGSRWGLQNLWDDVINPHQAGTLLQSEFLSPSEISSGQQFNQEQSPAAQAARSRKSGFGGLFGTILNIVSMTPIGAPLRPIAIAFNMANAVANENPIGLVTSAMGASDAFSSMGGYDPGAVMDGASNAASAYDAGSFMDAASGGYDAGSWMDNPVLAGTGDDSFLGSAGLKAATEASPNAWSEMVGDTVQSFDQGLNSPLSQQGLGMLSDPSSVVPTGGFDTGAINGLDLPSGGSFAPGTTENVFNPSTDGYGMGDAISSTQQSSGGLEGISYPATTNYSSYIPDYGTIDDAQNALNKANDPSNFAGYGQTARGSVPAMDTLGSTNSMSSTLNTLLGSGNPKQLSPLGWGVKGLGALDSVLRGRQAQGIMERQFNAANNWTDPNRARGDQANQMWLQNYQNPMAGYNEFMTGAGREFTDQARAQAAKSGRRGAYLNSGKMQSDLASLWMKNQLNRGNALREGFSAGNNNYAATASMAPGYAAMVRNQNAPIFDVMGDYLKTNSLSSLYGE